MQMALSRALTHSGAVGDFKQALLLPELLWLTACTGFETFGHSSPLRPLCVTSAFGNAAWAGLRTQTWACESESEPSVGRASVFRYLHTGAFRLGSAAQGSVLRTRQWAGRRCAERTASSDVPVWTCKLPSSFFFFFKRESCFTTPFQRPWQSGRMSAGFRMGGSCSFLPSRQMYTGSCLGKKKKKESTKVTLRTSVFSRRSGSEVWRPDATWHRFSSCTEQFQVQSDVGHCAGRGLWRKAPDRHQSVFTFLPVHP